MVVLIMGSRQARGDCKLIDGESWEHDMRDSLHAADYS